jgi:hypothetical protein
MDTCRNALAGSTFEGDLEIIPIAVQIGSDKLASVYCSSAGSLALIEREGLQPVIVNCQ